MLAIVPTGKSGASGALFFGVFAALLPFAATLSP
jgi:hypothetical protein